ncbi:MAG: MlaD family protein [Bacteroidota bacterium]
MSNALKVGLAVLLSAAFIFAGVRFLSGQPLFGAGYSVVAVFDDAQGLTPGAMVRLNGVRVGEVSNVELGPGARQVFVRMALDRGVEVPRGATITTSGLSALGEVNVEITPPTGADAGRPLTAGDTLLANPSPDLFDLLAGESNSLTARADTALMSAVRSFTQLDEILTNSGGDMTATLAQLRFLTQGAVTLITEERGRIDRTMASLEASAAGAEATATQVGEDVRDLSVVVGNDLVATSGTVRSLAETNADSISVAINQLNVSLRNLNNGLARLESISANLDTTLAAVNSPDGTMGLLLTDPSLYYNANAAAASLQQLIQDLQADPGRYLKEVDGLVKVF